MSWPDWTLAAIVESPLVGVGLDNFRYVAQKYYPEATPQQPHNMWLGLMAETGVVGALAAAFLFITWFELLLRARAWTHDRDLRRLAWASITSMMAVMAIFMTIPIMLHRHYWLLYGLGLSLVGVIGSSPRDPGNPVDESSNPTDGMSGASATSKGVLAP